MTRIELLKSKLDPAPEGIKRERSQHSGENGIVLIALLWVLVAVSLIALNLAFSVRGETAAAQATGEAERCYFYARGAIEVALYRICFSDRDPEKQKQLFLYAGGMHHFWMNQGPMLSQVAILDEAGKMDLNMAKLETLLRLFSVLSIPDDQKAILVEAIEGRRPTATSLQESGERNAIQPGPFVSIEELTRLKGVSQETLYGTHRKEGERTIHKRGLLDFLTVFSGTQRININSAELEVLAALPGMDIGMARSLVQAREEKPFEAADLAARTSGTLSGEAVSQVATDFSGTYCLVATSSIEHSPVRRSVKLVASLDRRGRFGHHRLTWYDEYWPAPQLIQWLRPHPDNRMPAQTAIQLPGFRREIL